MFYSHEILTSREGGIATVWLLATLGSRTNNKKVNRKSILEVDVRKTCDIIIQPEAPMALRLQGNLLYGVVRVYSRQYQYVLSDAETIQTNIRTLFKAVRTSELDPNAGKARPDQLVIQDDPAFLPDFAIPGLDIDLSALDMSTDRSSSLPSILSQRSQRSSISSGYEMDTSVLPPRLPTSDSGGSGGIGGFELPSDPAGSAQGSRGLAQFGDNEDFNVDLGFGFDEEGNMFEEPLQRERSSEIGNLRVGGDLSASGNMRQRQPEGVLENAAESDLLEMPNFNNDDLILPDAEAFPGTTVGNAAHDVHSHGSSTMRSQQETESSYGAPLVRKKRIQKQLPVDEQTNFVSEEFKGFIDNYVTNMAEERFTQEQRKAAAIAKKNASHWVMGLGIAGVGVGIGSQKIKSPLDVFSGPGFLDALRGTTSTVPQKRAREDEDDFETENERRNAREQGFQLGLDDDILLQDDETAMAIASEGIEVGRHAQPPMEDLSMPWNVSASSRQGSIGRGRGFQSSIGGFSFSAGAPSGSIGGPRPTSLDRRASRITSASPLSGRGQQRLSSLENRSQHEDTTAVADDGRMIPDPQALEDFEFAGPGAGVATQTAAESQWVKDALTQEAGNFLEFVKAEIDVRQPPVQGLDELQEANEASVLFEELLPPAQHSKTVAAQGFYHVLALATGGRLTVTQLNETDLEGFGPLRLQVPSTL